MTFLTLRNLIRCLSVKRVVNLARILTSCKLSELTGKCIVSGNPWTITIEPTNRCNLRCPECPSGNGRMTRAPGIMAYERFARIVDEIAGDTLYLQLFFQGEPLINPWLADMIAYAHDKRIYVSVSTNAHFIRPEAATQLLGSGLERIIISIDGLSDATYSAYRVGGNLSKVIDAIKTLRGLQAHGIGRRCELVLQFLITRHNEHEIPDLKLLARKYGATVALKTLQVYSSEAAAELLPSNEKFRRYRIVDGELRMKGKMRNTCARLWERSVITWDGSVVPCCFDKDAEYPLGKLDEKRFADIWNSRSYNSFRRTVLKNRRDVPICTNCTEGLRVYR